MTDKALNVSRARDLPLIVEKDIRIPMRDGSVLFADLFRPDGGAERFPCLMSLGPYQKDKHWVVPHDLEEEGNPYMNWEAPNPLWWCPRGYALVRIDTRGTGKTPGKSEPSSAQEAVDSYDACEWIGRQSWCNGRVGALGISYLAAFQWRMANLQPPSLKAIMPWEGRADQYRDQAYHGGIFAMGFIAAWHNTQTAHHLLGKPRSYNPDAFNNNLLWEYMRNDLDSEYWRSCSAQWDRITVPLYTVGNWGGFSMHLRGNTEAFMCAASRHKRLRIHTGTHFHPFYAEEARNDQLRWFDYWLKEIDTGIMDEPPVKLEIRTGGSRTPYKFRFENEWPIARTRWTKLYLHIDAGAQSSSADRAEGRLESTPSAQSASIAYPAGAPAHGHEGARNGIAFQTAPMREDTEVTGPIVLNVWVSSSSEDMDIYATLRNIDPEGKDVCEVGQRGEPVACVTKGWLRASHRKLDPLRSLPYRPYHAHDERWWLAPGEVVECRVEVWPTSMVFKKGHVLRLDITPRDGVGTQHFTHYVADYNAGATNWVHAGGEHESYLLLPMIPGSGGA